MSTFASSFFNEPSFLEFSNNFLPGHLSRHINLSLGYMKGRSVLTTGGNYLVEAYDVAPDGRRSLRIKVDSGSDAPDRPYNPRKLWPSPPALASARLRSPPRRDAGGRQQNVPHHSGLYE